MNETLSTRRGAAVIYLLGALFFAALGVGVVSAPAAMHPGLALLLRLFIGLLFGSLSLGALLAASRELRPAPSAPSALLLRCLCCGEPCGAESACPSCAQPPHDRAAALRCEPSRWIDAALFALAAVGVLCLGIFVAVGPYVDGERRLWVLVAVGALAVLLILVGAVGSLGAILDVREQWRVGAKFSAQWSDGARWLSGQGTRRGETLPRYEGSGGTRAPLRREETVEADYRSPSPTSLAESLALFEAAGLWSYLDERVWRWVIERDGARESLERSSVRQVVVEVSERPLRDEGELLRAVGAYLYSVAGEELTLAALRATLDESPEVRAQCEMHAEALREAGLRVSHARVATLQAALAAAAPSQGEPR